MGGGSEAGRQQHLQGMACLGCERMCLFYAPWQLARSTHRWPPRPCCPAAQERLRKLPPEQREKEIAKRQKLQVRWH